MKPDCTSGRQAMLADGASLFQSVLYPAVPDLSWMNCGTAPPEAPGFSTLHLLYRPPLPSPDMPHTLSSVTADMLLLVGRYGVCTS